MYCTYLTIYLGNKLPPFYIGYTKIKNIEKNYNGTVTKKNNKDKGLCFGFISFGSPLKCLWKVDWKD